MIGRWRTHFNEDRPHSSLGNLTPTEYAARLARGEITPRPKRPSTVPIALAETTGHSQSAALTARPGMHDGQAQDTRGPKKPGRSGGRRENWQSNTRTRGSSNLALKIPARTLPGRSNRSLPASKNLVLSILSWWMVPMNSWPATLKSGGRKSIGAQAFDGMDPAGRIWQVCVRSQPAGRSAPEFCSVGSFFFAGPFQQSTLMKHQLV